MWRPPAQFILTVVAVVVVVVAVGGGDGLAADDCRAGTARDVTTSVSVRMAGRVTR